MSSYTTTFHKQNRLTSRRGTCPGIVITLLVTLGLLWSAPSARADSLTIQFTGDLSGTGTLITDGTCSICSINNGLLALTIDLGNATGASAFDIVDDTLVFGGPVYTRSTNSLEAPLWDNSENLGQLVLLSPVNSPNQWSFDTLAGEFSGHFAITPTASSVPEPNTLVLVLLPLSLLGFRHIAARRSASHFIVEDH